ncbi:MAG: hypothetical protein ABI656_07410 [bacterium]
MENTQYGQFIAGYDSFWLEYPEKTLNTAAIKLGYMSGTTSMSYLIIRFANNAYSDNKLGSYAALRYSLPVSSNSVKRLDLARAARYAGIFLFTRHGFLPGSPYTKQCWYCHHLGCHRLWQVMVSPVACGFHRIYAISRNIGCHIGIAAKAAIFSYKYKELS